jgi:hypothetical protein
MSEGNWYELRLKPQNQIVLDIARSILDPSGELIDSDGDSCFSGFVQTDSEEFLEFTKKHPNIIFELYEMNSNQPVEYGLHYYLNGVHKEVVGTLVYPSIEEVMDFEKPEEVLKVTHDDWYPCIDDKYVSLKYVGLLTDGMYRVCVWGGDDFGLEKDYSTEEEAKEVYERLKATKVINKRDLFNIGFVNA